jgi:predicted PurR-regulated permease PerM
LVACSLEGDYFNTYLPGSGNFFTTISNNITLYIKVGLTWVINHLGSVLSGASIFLLHAFIFIITLYYVLIDGQNLKKRIIRLSPLDDKEDESVFARLELAVNSVIKGNVVIASIQGTLTALGFVLFGIPNSILWGLTAVISSLIPSIGTALVLVPGVLYLFVTGSTLNAVGLLLWGTIIVGAVDNVLKPKLIGTQLQVHPLFVLLSILGGISLLGPIGILLGPLVFSLLFALIDVYSHIKSKR